MSCCYKMDKISWTYKIRYQLRELTTIAYCTPRKIFCTTKCAKIIMIIRHQRCNKIGMQTSRGAKHFTYPIGFTTVFEIK